MLQDTVAGGGGGGGDGGEGAGGGATTPSTIASRIESESDSEGSSSIGGRGTILADEGFDCPQLEQGSRTLGQQFVGL